VIGWIRRRPVLAAVVGVCIAVAVAIAVVVVLDRVNHESPAEEFLAAVDEAGLRDGAEGDDADRQLVSDAKAFCRTLDEADEADEADEVEATPLEMLAVEHYCPEHSAMVHAGDEEGIGPPAGRSAAPRA
jgi:hypothetical protein